MADWIAAGSEAPAVSLKGTDGSTIDLSDFRGKPVVVYFYPKDDTPGCTIEACAFRDRSDELSELAVAVFGVSPDDIESHQAFTDKFNLNFPLLADTDHTVAESFGAWREKTRNGKTSMGVHRSTFLIDGSGVVSKVWTEIDVNGHDEEVLAAIRDLAS